MSTAPPPPPPPPSPYGLLPLLSLPLSEVHHGGALHHVSVHDLPPPGLQILPLNPHLSLPLHPSQALQLPALSPTTSPVPNVPIRFPPEQLVFHNTFFENDRQQLLRSVLATLGIEQTQGLVDVVFHGLFLYREGDRVQPHVPAHAQGQENLLAVVEIQLPSTFKAGQQIIRPVEQLQSHETSQQQTIATFSRGADDSSSAYTFVATAYYASLQTETLPLGQGFRLSLQYNVYHLRPDLPKPFPSLSHLDQLVIAFQQFVDRYPAGDWHVAFELSYTPEDDQQGDDNDNHTPQQNDDYRSDDSCSQDPNDKRILELGLAALKGADWRNVSALLTAAKRVGFEDIDAAICKLRWVEYEHHGFIDGSDQYISTMRVQSAYWEDGEVCTADLNWVDWDSAIDISNVDGQSVASGTDAGSMDRVVYSWGLVFWAADSRAESLFKGDDYDVKKFLNQYSKDSPPEPRARRMLGCLERRGWDHKLAWKQTREVFEFSLEHALHEVATGAITFAAMIAETFDIDKLLSKYIATHGWDSISEAVIHYVTPPPETDLSIIDSRLWTVFQLYPPLPTRIALDALSILVGVIAEREGKIAPETDNWDWRRPHLHDRRHKNLWVPLFSILSEAELNCADSAECKATLEGLVDRITGLMEDMSYRAFKPLHDVLASPVSGCPSAALDRLRECARRHFTTTRAKDFHAQMDFVIQSKTAVHSAGPYDDEYRRYGDRRGFSKRKDDWMRFLSLCMVMITVDESVEMSELVEDLFRALKDATRKDIDAFASALTYLDDSESPEFVSRLEEKVLEAREITEERNSFASSGYSD